MASPYPIELRTRVIEQTESGMKIVEASRLFNVHRETIATWIKIKKENSNCEAKKGYQKGHSHKIKNKEVFKEFIDKNKDKSCKELAHLWGKISASTIYNYLRIIGYSNKKNFSSPQKRCWKES